METSLSLALCGAYIPVTPLHSTAELCWLLSWSSGSPSRLQDWLPCSDHPGNSQVPQGPAPHPTSGLWGFEALDTSPTHDNIRAMQATPRPSPAFFPSSSGAAPFQHCHLCSER